MRRMGFKARIFTGNAAFLASLGIALALTVPARADPYPPAENYVRSEIQSGLSILENKSLSHAQQRDQVRTFLLSFLDTHRIAMFALGSAQKTATPSDLAAYADAFRDFIVESYVSRLSGYTGQGLNVTGSTTNGPGDYIVSAVIVDPTDPPGAQEPEVDLRVVDEGGKFFVVDAGIEGIWLMLAQRDDFAGFLAQHGGDVGALTAHLQQMTAKLNGTAGAN